MKRLILIVLIAAMSVLFFCTNCSDGNGGKEDIRIEEVTISNYTRSDDLYSFDVETTLNHTPEEIFYSLQKNDLNFHPSQVHNPSTIMYELKDDAGKIIWKSLIDGPGKRSITMPYRYLAESRCKFILCITLKINGKTKDKLVKAIELP
ncbi:MAG: hypothetical protein MJY76_06250 [Bacteroidales bacterium]|nr:hypothetical protein [Bacteroidales bacterium]